MQTTTKSPTLEAHQNALKIIYSFTTPEQFDSVPELLKEKRFEILRPTQIATLLWVADNQRKLYASNKPDTNKILEWRAKEIAEEYKEVDKEAFGAKEVSLPSVPYTEESPEIPTSNTIPTPIATEEFIPTSNIVPTPVETKEFTPASEELETKTRKTRKVWWLTPMPVPTQWVQSVTVSRRVNLPIEWVQYSNNEFNVSVTASNRDDAVNELNELTTSFLADQWLVRKSVHDKAIADLRAQLKAEQEKKVTTPAPAVDTELAKKHEKLRDMMNFIYKNSTNKEEFVALKNQFTSL